MDKKDDNKTIFGRAELTSSDLINLHATYYNYRISISGQISTYLSFFISSIVVVLGGSILVMNIQIINVIIQGIIISLCGILSLFLSIVMFKTYSRAYMNILDHICKIVIIEELLDLDNSKEFSSIKWPNDAIVLNDHINFRENTKSIKGFKKKTIKKRANQRRNVKILTIIFCVFSFIPILYGIIINLWTTILN